MNDLLKKFLIRSGFYFFKTYSLQYLNFTAYYQ
jgi:hypothetical protein